MQPRACNLPQNSVRVQQYANVTLAAFAALPPAEQQAALRADAGHTARLLYQAACHGVVEAQTNLGQILLDGRGTPADGAAARRWFAVAARQGYAPAANMLGRCLERGWGGSPDVAQAALWYRQAAEASLDWAQYNLANMLLRGRGVTRDVPQAFAYFLKAARSGHAKSMNLVARFLEEGWLGTIDLDAAEDWYRRAAIGGDFRAQYNLATRLVERGEIGEAVTWFEQSGREGSADFRRLAADQLLARPEQALRTVGLAIAARCCDPGEAEDHYRYGMALGTGGGTKPALAIAWLRRAHAAGHPLAATALAGLDQTRPARRRWLLRPKA
jgi:TPR repeat protein